MEEKREFKTESKVKNEPEFTRVQELEGESRSMAGTVATAYVVAAATGAGFETGKEVVKETVAKVKDARKPKESNVELPPGVDRPD
jgi:hypothetical protein